MKRLFAAAAVMCLAATPAVAATVLQAQTRAWPIGADQRVRLEFPVGELRVEASDGDRVRLELTAKCKDSDTERCMKRVERLSLDANDTGSALIIDIEGYPKMNPRFSLIGVLQVPRRNDLEIEMGVGELGIVGMEGSLDVDLGVGEADIDVSKESVRRVTVEVGIGDARIRAGGDRRESSGLFGREVRWSEGSGRATVKLNVGVGDARVSLR
jgi:hypothetical protein